MSAINKGVLFLSVMFISGSFGASGTSAATKSGFDTPKGVTEMPLAIQGAEVARVIPEGLLIPNANGTLNATSLSTLTNLLKTPPCASDEYLTKISATTFACKAKPVQATITDTTPPSSSKSVCTASALICQAYADNTGRLPDQAGADYWQSYANSLAAQGYSASQIKTQLYAAMSGTNEVATYTGSTANVDATVEKVQQNAYSNTTGLSTTTDCSSGTNCSSASNTSVSTSSSLTSAYQTILGRAPDAAGLQFYQDKINSGEISVDQAIADIKKNAANGAK